MDAVARDGRDGLPGRDGRDSHDTPTENRLNVALILRDLAYIKERIDQMCKSDEEQDDRLTKVERLTWAGASLIGLLSAIFIPISVAAIKKWFGL
jgi:hypothetical protein